MERASRQYWATSTKILSPEEEQSHLFSVRRIAKEVTSVKEFHVDDVLKAVSFRNFVHNCRIDVYYTTGTVGICFVHPVSGKVQQFHGDVSLTDIKELLQNPRVALAGRLPEDIFSIESVVSEDEALRNHLLDIERQAEHIKARLAEFESVKGLHAQQLAQQQARELADRMAALHIREQSKIPVPPVPPPVRGTAERNAGSASYQAFPPPPPPRRGKGRRWQGIQDLHRSNISYKIDEEAYITAQVDYALECVALCQGGSAFVFADGSCLSAGLPDEIEQVLVQQKHSNIAYIAVGEHKQYFIRKKNGRVLCHSGEDFERDIEMAYPVDPVFVAFGRFGTYFIQFMDGKKKFSKDFKEQVPKRVFYDICKKDIQHVAIGSTVGPFYRTVPFCVVYQNGDVDSQFEEEADGYVGVCLEHMEDGSKVTQVLLGANDNYFVGYTFSPPTGNMHANRSNK